MGARLRAQGLPRFELLAVDYTFSEGGCEL